MNSEELKTKVDKEFIDKLNQLSIEEIFYLIQPYRDIKYVHNVGIVSNKFWVEYINNIPIQPVKKQSNIEPSVKKYLKELK